jgi:hypothetical protein
MIKQTKSLEDYQRGSEKSIVEMKDKKMKLILQKMLNLFNQS